MRVVPTRLPEVVLVESDVHSDDRGYFLENYHAEKFRSVGLPAQFLQDNQSYSVQHTLRGLHYQLRQPQGKLVRAMTGSIFDVAVDIRRASNTFGEWVGVTLSEGDGRQLWIPPGFAHGFLVLSSSAHVCYKCTTLYDSESDRSVLWSDETLGVQWPGLLENGTPILSQKDAASPKFNSAEVFS